MDGLNVRVASVTAEARVCSAHSSKIAAVGDWHWRTCEVPHSIQPGEYSKGSAIDDAGHRTGEVFAVNVNWNADDRNWNVNAYTLDDNQWNAGNRVFSRTFCVSLALFGSESFC